MASWKACQDARLNLGIRRCWYFSPASTTLYKQGEQKSISECPICQTLRLAELELHPLPLFTNTANRKAFHSMSIIDLDGLQWLKSSLGSIPVSQNQKAIVGTGSQVLSGQLGINSRNPWLFILLYKQFKLVVMVWGGVVWGMYFWHTLSPVLVPIEHLNAIQVLVPATCLSS